jgi:glycerophosphoryl diester phosphodiesterase
MLDLVHHAANRGHDFPPGSLSALRTCLEAGAPIVEIDISPLAATADFALVHDGRLEMQTEGQGPVLEATPEQVARLHYEWPEGQMSSEPVGLLSQAVALVGRHPELHELQLDLKPHSPLDAADAARLLALIAPIRRQARVTSGADWELRELRRQDAGLALGFDPLLYFDLDDDEEDGEEERLPYRVGAYGYRDDHPLAGRRWGTPAAYLVARAEALLAQAPAGGYWYVRGTCLERALADGFDWIAYLHGHDILVDAWTLDPSRPGDLALARGLVARGVDRITTNEAPRMAAALGEGTPGPCG